MNESRAIVLLLSSALNLLVDASVWSAETNSQNPIAEQFYAKERQEWQSLIFIIANDVSVAGKQCRLHSLHYCLEGYSTHPAAINQRMRSGLDQNFIRRNKESFSYLMKDIWQQINMINLEDPRSCCMQQAERYISNGLLNQEMSPEQYITLLTDYDNEQNKPLNFVSAAYIREFCINMIFEVGFGPGQLIFDSRFELNSKLPFAIPGIEYGITGLPHIKTRMFRQEKLREQLTFHWFKHKIMCKDHPWICDSNGGSNYSTSAATK